MSTFAWLPWGVVAVAVGFSIWCEIRDSRTRSEEQAVLDELAGEYHSPADRIAALERDLKDTRSKLFQLANVAVSRMDALEAHLSGDEQPSGRHAHTGAMDAATETIRLENAA